MTRRLDLADAQVVVTGGAGCIGSNLTKHLLDHGVREVVVIDDLSSSFGWNIPRDNRIRFLNGSILDNEKMRVAFSEPPDVVFHLAAHFANQNSIDHPEADLMVNGLGTLRALESARMHDVSRFVYASSGCSVYGSLAPLPLKEDFVSLHLDTPYQVTKLLGELYCNFFHEFYQVPVTICRYFNVYGPGEVPGQYRNVIPNFIWSLLQGREIVVTGTGEETRDFTFVDDIVKGTLLAATSDQSVGQAFNLASAKETSVNQLVDLISHITGLKPTLRRTSRRPWDKISRRRASIDKARKILGYGPTVGMEKGIKLTYEWISEHRHEIEAVTK